jgi:hypothetical protein
MIASLARGVGKLTLLLVSLTVIVGVSCLLFGSYILTWPVLRLSPTNRKVRAMVDLSSAALAALAAMQPTEDSNARKHGSSDTMDESA